jgi:hypothetical protein
MNRVWCSTLAAMAIALGAQSVAAQPVNGCPAGQAMQASDPSGRNIRCVPIADGAALQAALQAETAARQAMDENILSIVGQLTETDIVGRWAMTGSTMCLQSSNGFNTEFMSPQFPTVVSQLHGTVSAVRTFRADNTGTSVGVSQSLSMPQLNFGTSPSPLGGTGGASLADLKAEFIWSLDPATGKLLIDDDNLVPQNFLQPPNRVGFSVTIENVPPFVGYISKDKKTIVLTHPEMALETSVLRDPSGAEVGRTRRFCARERVLTRLAD